MTYLLAWEAVFKAHEAFFSYLLGSVVGAIFTIIGVLLARFLQNKTERRDLDRKIVSLLHSLQAELKIINKSHMANIGGLIENLKEDEILTAQQYITENYFQVYESQCSLLGHMQDQVLKEKIVETYFLAKSMCDSIRTNTRLLEDYSDFTLRFKHSNLNYDQDKMLSSFQMLLSYARQLKKSHFELCKCMNETLTQIDIFIAANRIY